MTKVQPAEFKLSQQLVSMAICLGLSLNVLLVCGLYSVDNVFFNFFLIIHLAILLACVWLSLRSVRLVLPGSLTTRIGVGACWLLPIFCAVILGLLPVSARDALTHHLAVPKWWLQAGRIIEIPWHKESYYPMLLNLAFVGFIKAGLPQLSALYHLCYLIVALSAASLISLKISNNKLSAYFAISLMALLPIGLHLAASQQVDLGLTAFVGLALLVAIQADELSSKHFLQIGALLGFAIATKPNGALAIALFIPALIILRADKNLRLTPLLCLGAGILLCYGPWMLRSFYVLGNPFYPFLNSLFSANLETSQVEASLSLPPLAARHVLYGESWLEVLLTPVRIFLIGADNDPAKFDGLLSPLLLLGAFALWRQGKSKQTMFLTFYSLAYLLFALLITSARVRYLAPIYCPLAVLAGLGLEQLTSKLKTASQSWIAGSLIAIQLCMTLSYLYPQFTNSSAISFLTGAISGHDYLSKTQLEYNIAQKVSAAVSTDSRVYLLYTSNRYYYYDCTVFSGGYHSEGPLLKAIQSSQNVDELATMLRLLKIDHILIHEERFKGGMLPRLNERESELWSAFVSSRLSLVFFDAPYGLYKLNTIEF